ncbi:hypothetical protein [Lysobacter sp. A289]
MTDRLRLTLTPDDDGTAELHGEVVADGFSGRGSAWFNVSAIADFAGVLGKAFPLSDVVELKGGYWGKESGAGLTQEHLALRFYPVAGRGVLGCQVRLATSVQEHHRPEEQRVVRAELTTSYQELQQFSADLINLANGVTHEAVLHAVAV